MVHKSLFDEDKKYSLVDLQNTLPQGLNGAYEELFTDKLSVHPLYNQVIKPFLRLMVSMQEPLSFELTLSILKVDKPTLSTIAQLVRDIFPLRENCFYFFHKSIVDWLVNKDHNPDHYVVTNQGHILFSNYLLSLLPDFDLHTSSSLMQDWRFPESCPYLYTHLLDHLDACEMSDISKKLLSSIHWLMKVIDERGFPALLREINDSLHASDSHMKLIFQAIKLSSASITVRSIQYLYDDFIMIDIFLLLCI
jgi:hypothetical protein